MEKKEYLYKMVALTWERTMAIQYSKGGVKGHITSRYPYNAPFYRIIIESIVISGIKRRMEANLTRNSCSITLVWENCRSNIRME